MKDFTGHPAPKNPGNSTGGNGGPGPVKYRTPSFGPYKGFDIIPSGTEIHIDIGKNGSRKVTHHPPTP